MRRKPGIRQQILAMVRRELPGVSETSEVFRAFVVARAAKRVGRRGFGSIVQVTGYPAPFVNSVVMFLRSKVVK